jgi:hypothetical protein
MGKSDEIVLRYLDDDDVHGWGVAYEDIAGAPYSTTLEDLVKPIEAIIALPPPAGVLSSCGRFGSDRALVLSELRRSNLCGWGSNQIRDEVRYRAHLCKLSAT